MMEFSPNTSDEAVRSRTGKDWSEWLSILDEAGAQQKSHKEIVAFLKESYQVEPWWQQTIAVTYEQARGLREKGQAAGGYQVSASKTFPVDMGTLFNAWTDEAQRERWLPGAPMKVTKATPGKSVRISWKDGESRVEAYFTEKGESKSSVQVQHVRLANAEENQRMKAFWKDALKRLARVIT